MVATGRALTWITIERGGRPSPPIFWSLSAAPAQRQAFAARFAGNISAPLVGDAP